ncbi:hypothetical protein PAPHI01_1929 [Pancytospora philotis]|nr:hypothetical protein PAPHI01_1929 [Pancytospora philotis]
MVALAYFIAFVPLMAVYAFNIMARRHQLNYYIAHASTEVPKWEAYGMPANSYELSKYYLGIKMLSIHNEMLYTTIHLLPALLMALPFSIWDLGDALWEGVFYSKMIWDCAKKLKYLISSYNMLSIIFMLSVVALSVFVMGRKYGLAACCVSIFSLYHEVQTFSIHIFEGSNYINNYTIPRGDLTRLSEFKGISGDIRNTIFEICGAGGVPRDYVLVKHDDSLNAACSSGLRWGYIEINAGTLKRAKPEHVYATLMHELEHYKRMHSFKDTVYSMAVHLLFCAAIYFLYRKAHMLFKRPCLAVISSVWATAFATLMPLINNGCWGIGQEYEADIGVAKSKYSAYGSGRLLEVIINTNGGVFFDNNYPFTITRTHPSIYNRIQAHEKLIKK